GGSHHALNVTELLSHKKTNIVVPKAVSAQLPNQTMHSKAHRYLGRPLADIQVQQQYYSCLFKLTIAKQHHKKSTPGSYDYN
ncbi:unnamed protein product, partial [Urochloa humidicola]